MTPGKIAWKEFETIYQHNLRKAGSNVITSVAENLGKSSMTSGGSLHRRLIDMLRGFIKMDVREKDRKQSEPNMGNKEDTSTTFQDGGSALIQCVERFFKNPQQNYEVPLQLLQEWFSDTSTHRRQELAKLFLTLLEEQGLDMEQVTGSLYEYPESCKSEVFLDVEEPDENRTTQCDEDDSDEKLGTISGRSNSPGRELRVYSHDRESSSSKKPRWSNPALISDPTVLKSLREFRPLTYKTKPETFLEAVEQRNKSNRVIKESMPKSNESSDSGLSAGPIRLPETADVGVYANEQLDALEMNCLTNSNTFYTPGGGNVIGSANDYPLDIKQKSTRSVGTSPFKEGNLTNKCSSEPNLITSSLTVNCRKMTTSGVAKHGRGLRKSVSLPSVRCSETILKMPPLAPIEVPKKKVLATKEMGTSTINVTPSEFPKQTDNKPSVINSTTVLKPRTTFVEMSHAEFIKRQILLNERVSVRQGFRLGGQILYVPELVSCSAPHVEKPTPPLLVHSNVDIKRTRNPVEIKLTMMGNTVDGMENVVVSQSNSSHTIHYTPSSNHIVSAPSQRLNDKCSVVYVRDSLPHAQPVLVATTPTPTWQEEARKKPIIAYAKRKPPEPREKIGNDVMFSDNMKVLITPNGLLNTVHDVQPTKVITQCKPAERDRPVSTPVTTTPSVTNATTNTTPCISETSFPKRPVDDRSTTSDEETTKPTLPKFNQTFVQNFQLKTVHPAETLSQETQQSDLCRKVPKKVASSFSAAAQVGAETTVMTEDNVSQEPPRLSQIQSTSTGVIHSTLTVPPTPVVVERPVQMKPIQSVPPAQVGLLIYTQATPEESTGVQTLLLTTLPNGSAYCVRIPANAGIAQAAAAAAAAATPATAPATAQLEGPRPLVMQATPLTTPVTVKPLKKAETLPVAPPVESNKVALLKDLKEFENVFEETKLKFEKEKQLSGGEPDSPNPKQCIVATTPPPQPAPAATATVIPKFDCEKVVVGVKRKPEGEIPVVTRLYTTAKKPLIVVANYGQSTPPVRPVIAQTCSTSPPSINHMPNKSPKSKSRSGKTYPNPSKSPPTAKPQQKPQEDEKTQQKIYAILEEYAVQKEHSPDTNNRPAPRRRSNPPSASASKKKRPVIKSKDASGDSEDGSFSEM